MIPLYWAAERHVVLKINSGISTTQALAILTACYYIFNTEYPTSLKNVFVMLVATTEPRMQVEINKFLEKLDFEQ